MLVRYTQISQASGSIGGQVAAKNRSGDYLRKRVKPLNPQTEDQQRVREFMATAAAGWPAATDAQRSGWNEYANTHTFPNRLGVEVKLSGIALYTRTNALKKAAGLGLQDSVYDGSSSTQMSSLTAVAAPVLDVSSNNLTLTLQAAGGNGPWAGQDDGVIFVYMSRAQSPGRAKPAGGYRFFALKTGETAAPLGGAQVFANGTGFELINTQAYFIRAIAMDEDGRVSLDQTFRVLATP